MWPRRQTPIIGGVPAYTNRVVLEFDSVDGSLIGRATTSAGAEHEFTGWVGLLTALQMLVAGNDPSASIDHEPTQG